MKEKGASRRERAELTVTALLPGALALLSATVRQAGRLAWLTPLLALPLGLGLCLLWRKLGEEDLPHGLEGAFGRVGGRLAEAVYLLWCLFLLALSAQRYAQRLTALFPDGRGRWLFLLTALALSLWLSRGDGAALARSGRLFFLATLAALVFALALSVPSFRWQNLWPPEGEDGRGLPAGAALTLSLCGYGVYGLCLPRRREGELRAWPWAAWSCGLLCALALAVVGCFGPRLAGEMAEPFYFLTQGVEVPGAFRRGEAVLGATLALADLTLLALLSWSCRRLWSAAAPPLRGRGWGAPVAAAFVLAGSIPNEMAERLLIEVAPAGDLLLGAVGPALAVLTGKLRETRKGASTFSGEKTPGMEDVGGKSAGKKSRRENEKKC